MCFRGTLLQGAVAAIAATTFFAFPARSHSCEFQDFESGKYIICTVDPAKSDLQLFWKGNDGKPYRSFARLARELRAEELSLSFAINAGMYLEDFSPMGLFVQNGKEYAPLNNDEHDGKTRLIPNFFKKPNGVFFTGEAGAGILTTEEFIKRRPAVKFATQSGPMLVIQNVLHPAFIVGSSDRTRRSGVGVCEAGNVHFAISQGKVNFHDFARLFRDELKCPDALFLDGGEGAGLYSPFLRRNDWSWHGGYGPILGLVEPSTQ